MLKLVRVRTYFLSAALNRNTVGIVVSKVCYYNILEWKVQEICGMWY